MVKLKISLIPFLLLSSVLFGQIDVKDSVQIILQNDTVDANLRFTNAYNLIFFNSSPEEAEELAMSVIYPFVLKTWDKEASQLTGMARLYLLIGFCHRERGGDDRYEKERYYLEKALENALKSENNSICARCFEVCGAMEIKRGEIKKAHEYLYQAIVFYDKMELYVKSSEMLYIIASNFFDIKDSDGMQRVINQMTEYLQKDASKQSMYQYNVIKKTYFDLLLEKEKDIIDYKLVDSTLVYVQKNIDLVENFIAELSPFWMHGYAYYHKAKTFDDYYPEHTDTIFLYLDKAIEMMTAQTFSQAQEANAVMEFNIFINTLRANTLSRIGKMQEAYNFMNEALLLLDELHNYKNLNELRYNALLFMADYYEKINNPAEALQYHKRLRESEAQRYETEKIQAINDMSVKYETEKKEIQIETLAKEHKATQRILQLTIGLSLTLFIAFFLMIMFGKQKQKNLEQQLYETALLAELKQNELEKTRNINQHLEQNPVKNTINIILQMVSASLIEKDTKNRYIEGLTKIDAKMLENAYQTSKAKITSMDIKYIICFAADLDTKDISLIFNIEPASVNTVRYRIKKKFAEEDAFRMIF